AVRALVQKVAAAAAARRRVRSRATLVNATEAAIRRAGLLRLLVHNVVSENGAGLDEGQSGCGGRRVLALAHEMTKTRAARRRVRHRDAKRHATEAAVVDTTSGGSGGERRGVRQMMWAGMRGGAFFLDL